LIESFESLIDPFPKQGDPPKSVSSTFRVLAAERGMGAADHKA